MTGMSVSISCCWLSESPPLPAAAWMAAHQLAKANFFSPSMYRVLFMREKRENKWEYLDTQMQVLYRRDFL